MFGWIKDSFINTHYKANPILSKFPQVRFNPNNISEYGFKYNEEKVPEKIENNCSYKAFKLTEPLSHLILMTDLLLAPDQKYRYRYFFFDSNGLLIEFWVNDNFLNMSGVRLENSVAYEWLTRKDLEMLNDHLGRLPPVAYIYF